METAVFFAYIIANLSYIIIGIYLYWALVQNKLTNKNFCLTTLFIGIISHTIILYPNIFTIYGLNLNLFNTLSLTSLFLMTFFCLFSLYRPILILGTLATPIALIGLNIGYLTKAAYNPITHISLGLEAHILLSLAAYCVLLMSAVQAIILRLQIRELKHHTINRFWVNQLPPLQSMEGLLLDMILIGFIILTIALLLGILYIHNPFAQHISHKIFFSIVSWLLQAWLLVAHWRSSWSCKKTANITLIAFSLLAIGFIGSKTVLELIL